MGDALGALIEPLLPDIAFHALTSDEDVAPLLERVQPDATYSINGASFAQAVHRTAASYPSVRSVHVGGSGYDHVLPIPSDRILTSSPGLLAGPHATISLNAHVLNSASLSPLGCRPSMIAATMSGARQVSGRSRQT